MQNFKEYANDVCKVCGQTPCNCTTIEEQQKHKVAVTVSEPDHPAVTMRKVQRQKFVKVTAGSKEEASKKAHAFYKKQGYKVHSTEYHSAVNEGTDKDLPFTPDKPRKPVAKAGKYGSGYSTARHLARQGMQQQKQKVKEANDDPCWKDYEMVGMKNKNGKKVPNCVPSVKESLKADIKALRSMIEEASYKVDVEGLPTMYVTSASPTEVKTNLRKILKKADMIKSVDRIPDVEVKKAFRLKAMGKDEGDQ